MRKVIVFVIIISLSIPMAVFSTVNYEVKKGDTLWDLAAQYLNNPFMWEKIYEANKNQIEDPHWIYPGQVFVIPDVEGEVQEETSYESVPVEEGMTSDVGEAEGEYIPQAQQETKTESKVKSVLETTEKVKKVSADIEKIKKKMVFGRESDQMAYKGGFITKENMKIGRIIGAVDKNHIGGLVVGDKVYVKTLNGVDLSPGDKVSIYRMVKNIKGVSPKTKFGNLYYFVGTAQITGIKNNVCEAMIVEAFDRLNPSGEDITYYRKFEMPRIKEMKKATNNIEGYIIATEVKEGILVPHDIVYIDKGVVDGVKSGDIFQIERFNKKTNVNEVAGMLQVLHCEDNTSSAVLINIGDNVDIGRGDKIKLILEPVYEE